MLRMRSVRGLFLQNVFSKHAHVRDVHWHIHVFCDDAMPSLRVQCHLCVCKQCVSRCGHRIVCIGSLFSRRDVFGMAQTRHHEVACVAFRQCFEAPLCQDQCRHRQHCWRALLFVAQRCSSSQALWARKPVAFMTTYSSPS